jgi:hypothetical protein
MTDKNPIDSAVLRNETSLEFLLPLVSEISGIPLERLQEIKDTRGTPTGEEVLKLLEAITGEDGEGFLEACGLRD